MVLAEQILTQSLEKTIQVKPDARKEYAGDLFYAELHRGPLLPRWGTQERERYLRYNIYYHDYNWIAPSSFAGVMKHLASIPFEIKGPASLGAAQEKTLKQAASIMGFALPGDERPDLEYYQQILRQANFGEGWTAFVMKGVDYLRQDRGWVWEVILSGDPLSDSTSTVLGIAYLDSLKCRPTGDPNYPIVYFDKKGKRHLMQSTHVRQLVDMPDGDERRPGYGLCALSRAASIVNRVILQDRYVEAVLDDKPKPGIIRTNMSRPEWDRAMGVYRQEQGNDERPEWGKVIRFHSGDVAEPLQLDVISFTEAPEKFDYKVYTEVTVNELALALGVDVQELWQLTSGNLGTGTQSEILHQKSQGKTIGTLLTTIERAVNDILPEEYEFTFKFRDSQEDLERAQIAAQWATVVSTAGSNINAEEARQLLANTVEEVKDAITDENGKIRRLHDADVGELQTLDDSTAGNPAGTGGLLTLGQLAGSPAGADSQKARRAGMGSEPAERTVTPDDAASERVSAPVYAVPAHQPAARLLSVEHGRGAVGRLKDIQSTRLEFEAAFGDAVQAAKDDDVSRRRFGIVVRALINRLGKQAYKDGLVDGGVEDDLSEDDLSAIAALVADQSSYVTDFADVLFSGTDPNPESKAEMWANKSLMPFYQEGLASSDKNGLYEWVYGDTDHCEDCARLNGQKHRLSGWLASGFMPQGEALACHGFRCACTLVKTSGRASGGY